MLGAGSPDDVSSSKTVEVAAAAAASNVTADIRPDPVTRAQESLDTLSEAMYQSIGAVWQGAKQMPVTSETVATKHNALANNELAGVWAAKLGVMQPPQVFIRPSYSLHVDFGR